MKENIQWNVITSISCKEKKNMKPEETWSFEGPLIYTVVHVLTVHYAKNERKYSIEM